MSLEISAETSFALDLTNAIQYGPELHTDSNAASDPNGNEADAITGWDAYNLNGTGSNVFESQNSVVDTGSFAFHANANDTPTSLARFLTTITVEDGETYLVTGSHRHVGTGGNWRLYINDSVISTLESTDTSFTTFSYEITVSGTDLEIKYSESSATNNGGVYVDNISVKKIL